MQPTYIFLAIIAIGVIWLLLREVNAWYWKINDILTALKAIRDEIRLLRGGSQNGDQWKCPQCGQMNPNSTFICPHCKYSLT